MKSYMVSKHGVVALSEGLAGELDGTRVGVSVLCPEHHEPSSIYENSASFRPTEFGGPMPEIAGLAAEAAKRRHEGSKDATGRGLVERRFEQILAGFDDAGSFTGD